VHGGAVTAFSFEGSTCPCVDGACEDDEDEDDELLLLDELELLELLLLLELELLLAGISHGGTTSLAMLLFSATTSWF
jgi:hypothetical protein